MSETNNLEESVQCEFYNVCRSRQILKICPYQIKYSNLENCKEYGLRSEI